MPPGQAEEIIALAIVFIVHVVGGVLLVWALIDADQRAGWRRRFGFGGGDDGGPPRGPQPPDDDGGGARAPLPLADGAPSRVRLREPARAADGYPRPSRRPAHPPQPGRTPAPAPERRRRV